MKKLFILAFAACAFAACSKDEDVPTPAPETFDVISFEPAENMLDFKGEAALPGDVTMVGGVSDGTYKNVFMGLAYAEAGNSGMTFDNLLFSTTDEKIWFGSYYNDGTGWGAGRMDMWYGITLSKNYNMTATKMEYKNQFSAWASKGANNTDTFAACYDGGEYGGGAYSTPSIEFAEPRIVDHCYFANSTMVGTYESSKPDYSFAVDVVGALDGTQVGTCRVVLVKGETKEKNWVKADLHSLGQVDNLKFIVVSNDAMAPTYFCIDEIALKKSTK